MVTCRMLCHSNSTHLSQIFTGFALLERAGEIILSQECRKDKLFDATKPQHLRDARNTHVLVQVNDDIKLYYDCHDSYEIDEPLANEVDYYFKRSYRQAKIPNLLKTKVFPLGLNYPLYPAEIDSLEQQRVSAFGPDFTDSNLPLFRPTIENMHSSPDSLQDERVLFITRAWNPSDNPERSNEKKTERICLNEMRARCIELLRREFGNRFLGGFLHTAYAIKNYEHVLLPDDRMSAKENYIKLVTRSPVCVATAGLHGSNGWKIGEYVAFSKAIASERLNYQIPGDFRPGENYLEFDAPEGCVEAVYRLVSDSTLRWRMMQKNCEYYLNYLRPDSLIRRTLDIALLRRHHSSAWV
jgi:hypothetical protein